VSIAFTSPRYFGWLTLRLCRFSAPTAAKNRGQSMAGASAWRSAVFVK